MKLPGACASQACHRHAEAALYSTKHLEEIATETSETERRAASAERELIDWKTAQFMEQHLGEEYEALIISVQKYGCFVELFEVFVEGLLPITRARRSRRRALRLSRTRSRHRRRSRRRFRPRPPLGRGKTTMQLTWKLGDRIRVRAERIDPIRRRVEFALSSG